MRARPARAAIRLATLAAVATAALLSAACAGMFSGTPPAGLGVVEDRLAPVPADRRNAVSSFADTPYHRIAPLRADPDPQAAFRRLEALLHDTPEARVVERRPGYLHAEFRTPLMRFVDDVEFLLDAPGRVIHVRSASRLGRDDFGTNRRRVERLRERFSPSPTSAGDSK
jgi:uncharacterized protein (DUF1499 family)